MVELLPSGLHLCLDAAPALALVDEPITLHGPAFGVWHSTADFIANAAGVVDLQRDAPVSGSYAGVEPMGLLWSMVPASAPTSFGGASLQPLTVTFTAE